MLTCCHYTISIMYISTALICSVQVPYHCCSQAPNRNTFYSLFISVIFPNFFRIILFNLLPMKLNTFCLCFIIETKCKGIVPSFEPQERNLCRGYLISGYMCSVSSIAAPLSCQTKHISHDHSTSHSTCSFKERFLFLLSSLLK